MTWSKHDNDIEKGGPRVEVSCLGTLGDFREFWEFREFLGV